jgi:cytochrome c-type biogenesis protein CcmH
VDLRNQMRRQLRRGRRAEQIIDFMVQRYGDFVLYRPPVKGSDLAAVGPGPAALLVVASAALLLILRRRSQLAGRALRAGPGRAGSSHLERRRARPACGLNPG